MPSKLSRPPEALYAGLSGLFLFTFGALFLLFGGVDFDPIVIATDEPTYVWWLVNGWMGLLWIVIGALGLFAAQRQRWARRFALGSGMLFAGVAIAALAADESIAGVLVAGVNNTATYGLLAALGLWVGTLDRGQRWQTPEQQPARSASARFTADGERAAG